MQQLGIVLVDRPPGIINQSDASFDALEAHLYRLVSAAATSKMTDLRSGSKGFLQDLKWRGAKGVSHAHLLQTDRHLRHSHVELLVTARGLIDFDVGGQHRDEDHVVLNWLQLSIVTRLAGHSRSLASFSLIELKLKLQLPLNLRERLAIIQETT